MCSPLCSDFTSLLSLATLSFRQDSCWSPRPHPISGFRSAILTRKLQLHSCSPSPKVQPPTMIDSRSGFWIVLVLCSCYPLRPKVSFFFWGLWVGPYSMRNWNFHLICQRKGSTSPPFLTCRAQVERRNPSQWEINQSFNLKILSTSYLVIL